MYFPEITTNIAFNAYVDGKIQKVNLYDYKGKGVVMFFYPRDFTFVCPTEINSLSDRHDEFAGRNAVVLLVSGDSEYSHEAWTKFSTEDNGISGVKWPLISDSCAKLSSIFGYWNSEIGSTKRATVILDKNFNVFYSACFHDKIGRSTDEILRILDAMNNVNENKSFCPANWKRNQ